MEQCGIVWNDMVEQCNSNSMVEEWKCGSVWNRTVEQYGKTVEQCGETVWNSVVEQRNSVVEQCRIPWWNSGTVWHSVVEQSGTVWWSSETVSCDSIVKRRVEQCGTVL